MPNNPIRLVIQPAKQRFGRRTKRAQWRYQLIAANGENLSDRDSYANAADIEDTIRTIRTTPIIVEIRDKAGAVVEKRAL